VKALILSQTNLLWPPLVAVVLFVTVFAAMLAWIYRPGARAAYEARARLPLESGEVSR